MTRSVGIPNANFVCADAEHESAFASWHRAKEAENESCKTNARIDRTQQRKPLLVVVHNQPVVAIVLAEILRRKGNIAVWFTDSLRALDYLTDNPVDLLLSDGTLPAMDGLTLAAHAHAIQHCCKTLLLSAVDREAEVIDPLAKLGIKVDIELKPLLVPCLVMKIDRLLVVVKTRLALAGEL